MVLLQVSQNSISNSSFIVRGILCQRWPSSWWPESRRPCRTPLGGTPRVILAQVLQDKKHGWLERHISQSTDKLGTRVWDKSLGDPSHNANVSKLNWSPVPQQMNMQGGESQAPWAPGTAWLFLWTPGRSQMTVTGRRLLARSFLVIWGSLWFDPGLSESRSFYGLVQSGTTVLFQASDLISAALSCSNWECGCATVDHDHLLGEPSE